LVGTFSEFSQNLFDKRRVASSHFSKEFCVNPRKELTNRKRVIVLSCLQKSFVNSKALDVAGIRIDKFSIRLNCLNIG
jgi:hypothetical protein